jgi:hypothetical protein
MKLIIFDLLKNINVFWVSVEVEVAIIIVVGDIIFFDLCKLPRH